MSKNIVFCADGTWNGPGEPDSDDKTADATNVFKLFLNLGGIDTPDTYQLGRSRSAFSPQRTEPCNRRQNICTVSAIRTIFS